METINEKELIALSQHRNEGAFSMLLDFHRNSIINHIRAKYKMSHEDIEDFVQNASLKAWQKINTFRGDSSFMTWFCSIVRNELLNHVKKPDVKFHDRCLPLESNGDNEKIGLNFDDLSYFSMHALEPNIHETALSLIEKHELLLHYRKILQDALMKLSLSHREILELILEKEMSYEEAARKLNIPIGTVMSRLFFAKKHAKQILKQYDKFSAIQLSSVG
jgi:RNA polymerase sigma-70 factor (ECF subfamily)